MKRNVVYIAVLACLLLLSCTPQSAKKTAGKQVLFRLAETHPLDFPTTRGDQRFADLVYERSNGRIKIEVYHSSQLGQEKDVIEQVQFGGIDFTRVSISPLTSFAPQLNVLQLPYIFRDAGHEWAVLNGDIGEELLASLSSAGFVGLGWFDSGARNFYNITHAIFSPADLKGLKIRVQQSDLMIDMIQQLGAIAVPLAYGEVYAGLQLGIVECAENNWPSYESTRHYEVAPFLTLDEHTRVPEIVIASKISMDKLSKEDQALIKQAMKDSTVFQIDEWKKEEELAQEKVRASGCTVTVITDKSEFQKAMLPVYEKQTAEVQALIKRIQTVP